MATPSDTGTAPTDTAGDRFDRLVQIMRRLRSPDGCAWDREQTLASLRPFVLEEAYEVVDAIDSGDRTALCDEIGDLLLEAVFVAQICAETGDFTISDAADAGRDAQARNTPRRHPRGVAVPAPGVADRRSDRERRFRLGRAERCHRQGR